MQVEEKSTAYFIKWMKPKVLLVIKIIFVELYSHLECYKKAVVNKMCDYYYGFIPFWWVISYYHYLLLYFMVIA